MPDVATEGPHVHEACQRCGQVEGEIDGLCAECARAAAVEDLGDAVYATFEPAVVWLAQHPRFTVAAAIAVCALCLTLIVVGSVTR